MWILVINLLLLPDPSTEQTLPFTYIEREARLPFLDLKTCERELHRWDQFFPGATDVGDAATELPEAEGNSRWTPVEARCVSTEPPIA